MVQIEKVEMTDEDLKETKLQLAFIKLQKDDSDLALKELEDTLDKGVARMLLDDDIATLVEQIDSKTVKDAKGEEVDATKADLLRMGITLEKFKAQRELDMPTRQLILKINQIRDAKERIDSPDKQIKKLEKQIREKAFEQTVKPQNTTMVD